MGLQTDLYKVFCLRMAPEKKKVLNQWTNYLVLLLLFYVALYNTGLSEVLKGQILTHCKSVTLQSQQNDVGLFLLRKGSSDGLTPGYTSLWALIWKEPGLRTIWNQSVTERLRLAASSGGHLVQPPYLHRAT